MYLRFEKGIEKNPKNRRINLRPRTIGGGARLVARTCNGIYLAQRWFNKLGKISTYTWREIFLGGKSK
jgi:hypothetical protein